MLHNVYAEAYQRHPPCVRHIAEFYADDLKFYGFALPPPHPTHPPHHTVPASQEPAPKKDLAPNQEALEDKGKADSLPVQGLAPGKSPVPDQDLSKVKHPVPADPLKVTRIFEKVENHKEWVTQTRKRLRSK